MCEIIVGRHERGETESVVHGEMREEPQHHHYTCLEKLVMVMGMVIFVLMVGVVMLV